MKKGTRIRASDYLTVRCMTGILVLAFVFFAASPKSAGESTKENLASLQRAVVIVTTYDDQTSPLLQGSGFFLTPDLVVTNFHVIEHASKIRIESFRGPTFTVKAVIATNGASDLALLQIETSCRDITTLQLADELAAEGDLISVLSNPQGSPWTVSYGRVGRIWQFEGASERLQITADILPGSSGGPVLNQQGKVIGVAAMRMDSADDLNFAVPAENLKALQASALANTKYPANGSGCSFLSR